jgi:hypothetical protein
VSLILLHFCDTKHEPGLIVLHLGRRIVVPLCQAWSKWRKYFLNSTDCYIVGGDTFLRIENV